MIDQSRVDAFAEVTGDYQYIHVDSERASRTPFGGTIAHGFLTLSLLGGAAPQVLPPIEGAAMGLNYGLNKVRFIKPVRTGRRVRTTFRLVGVAARGEEGVMSTVEAVVEIEGEDGPALVAEWLSLAVLGGGDDAHGQ